MMRLVDHSTVTHREIVAGSKEGAGVFRIVLFRKGGEYMKL